MLTLDRKIFNRIYAKYFKKDYFSEKEYIRNRIKEAKQLGNYIIKFSEVKKYLRSQKEKAFTCIDTRINEYNQGKTYPKRERFTWEIIEALKKGG
jgi:hypothetical protein